MNWNVNDKFKISGIAELNDCSVDVHTYGVIVEILSKTKARVILDKADGQENVSATVRLRYLKPIPCK